MSNFSDGPLMYTYRVTQLKLHFGKTDTEGSEHSVDGKSFAAEANDEENAGFRGLVEHAKQVPWQGQTNEVKELEVKSLLPDTNYYLTYEGSLTQPACHETVTWVLFNKPIPVSRVQGDLCNMKKIVFYQAIN
ncbi:hypothetical protein ACOMHN_013682 [Nucella lapillus]